MIAYHLAVDDPLTRVTPTDTNSYPAALIGGTSEYSMRAIAQSDVRRGDVMRLSAALSSTPIVLSAELFVRITPAVAHRRRYGVRLPPTLAEMRPGDVALSDLLFLRLPSRATKVPDQPDEAARLMAGSLSFERTRPLAVYWESYGFAAADTVDVEVRVRRDHDISVARRIGAALGANVIVARQHQYSMARAGCATRRGAIAAHTPVIGRSLSLEVSELPPGTYLLAILHDTAEDQAPLHTNYPDIWQMNAWKQERAATVTSPYPVICSSTAVCSSASPLL